MGEVLSVGPMPRLYNEDQLPIQQSPETAVRRVKGDICTIDHLSSTVQLLSSIHFCVNPSQVHYDPVQTADQMAPLQINPIL